MVMPFAEENPRLKPLLEVSPPVVPISGKLDPLELYTYILPVAEFNVYSVPVVGCTQKSRHNFPVLIKVVAVRLIKFNLLIRPDVGVESNT
jgi:hypothetical protein